MITWSTTLKVRSRPASTSRRVKPMSSREGVGSPEGWLCDDDPVGTADERRGEDDLGIHRHRRGGALGDVHDAEEPKLCVEEKNDEPLLGEPPEYVADGEGRGVRRVDLHAPPVCTRRLADQHHAVRRRQVTGRVRRRSERLSGAIGREEGALHAAPPSSASSTSS